MSDCIDLQKDLDCFLDYCHSNKLYLSLSKCHSITFTKKIHVTKFNYCFRNNRINNVTCLRDLGVQLDSKLHLDNHIEKIVSQAYKMFGFVMRASREFHRPSTYLHLYKSIIRPQLEYASSIWNPHYDKYTVMLESVQRKYLRAMHFRCFRRKTSYLSLLKTYKIMNLKSRRTLLDMMTLFNLCHNKVDCTDLVSSLCYLVPRTVRGREVRTRHLFATKFCHTNAGVRSPLHRLVDDYNKQFTSVDIVFLGKGAFKNSITAILNEELDNID